MFHCVDKHTTAALAQCNFDVICVQWGPGASRVSCRGPKLHINVAGIGHCEEREGGGGDEEQLCRHVASSGVAARSVICKTGAPLLPIAAKLLRRTNGQTGLSPWVSREVVLGTALDSRGLESRTTKTRERVLKFQASAKSRNQTSNHGEHCHRHTIVAECNI